MIRSWANSATRQFAETGKSKYSGMDVAKAHRRLSALDQAETLSDLGPLKSVGLHKLSGNRKRYWAITINGPWRVVFRFENSDAHDVEIVDYH